MTTGSSGLNSLDQPLRIEAVFSRAAQRERIRQFTMASRLIRSLSVAAVGGPEGVLPVDDPPPDRHGPHILQESLVVGRDEHAARLGIPLQVMLYVPFHPVEGHRRGLHDLVGSPVMDAEHGSGAEVPTTELVHLGDDILFHLEIFPDQAAGSIDGQDLVVIPAEIQLDDGADPDEARTPIVGDEGSSASQQKYIAPPSV